MLHPQHWLQKGHARCGGTGTAGAWRRASLDVGLRHQQTHAGGSLGLSEPCPSHFLVSEGGSLASQPTLCRADSVGLSLVGTQPCSFLTHLTLGMAQSCLPGISPYQLSLLGGAEPKGGIVTPRALSVPQTVQQPRYWEEK